VSFTPGDGVGLYSQIDRDLWVDLPTVPLFPAALTLVFARG